MNKSYKLVFNRALGALQVAPETAGNCAGGQVLKPLAGAVLLALLGASPQAMALPGDCDLSAESGTFASGCNGASGSAGSAGVEVGVNGGAGGAGGAAAHGSGFTLTTTGVIEGGAGGAGGSGNSANGGAGGQGGVGLAATGFTLTNQGSIEGGTGGVGGFAGTAGNGGNGGQGGTGVSGGDFTLYNTGSILGGAGGTGGNSESGSNGSAGQGGVGVISTGGSTIYNSGTITAGAGANAIELTGAGNRLVLRAGSTITGGVQAGNATVQVGDTGSLYTSSHINGAFTLGSGGVFSIAAQSNNDETGYSRLIVSGSANIAGSAFVNVAEANTLANGQTLTRVLDATSLSGNFTEVNDNSALFDFVSRVNGNDIDFDILTAATTSVTSSAQANNNNPALGAARVLDQIIASGSNNPDMQQVVTALGQLETEQQVSDAASQTLPLLVGSSQAAAGNASNAIGNVLQGRLGGGQSSGEAMLAEGELWLQPFGTWANQDERDGVAGFDVDTYGLVFGGDAALNEQTRLGLAIAYANSTVDGDSQVAPNSADMDLYQLIGYGSHDFDAATQLTWQLDYGQGRTDGQRQILFMGSTAKSSYTSHIAHAGVGLSHSYSLGTATELTPTLRADYSWIKDDSYQEKGADALNLDVDGRTTDSLVLALEGELSHAFDERLQGVLKLGVGYDVIGEQATITSAYAGEPGLAFVTQGLDPSPWLGLAGMGLNYRVSDSTELSANYDAAYREDFLSHSASLTARWAF